MSEKILTAKEQRDKEDAELVANHFALHPEQLKPKTHPLEYEQRVTKFLKLIALFEFTHSLPELHLIIELTPGLNALFMHDRDMSVDEIVSALKKLSPEDIKRYKVRTAAKKDLIPIAELLNTFSKESKELKEKYMRLSRAVGMINSGKVDHNR